MPHLYQLARIQQRLTPVEEEKPTEPEKIKLVEGTPTTKTNGDPYKPVKTKSFIESLAEYL